jgi:hypothetical protein
MMVLSSDIVIVISSCQLSSLHPSREIYGIKEQVLIK